MIVYKWVHKHNGKYYSIYEMGQVDIPNIFLRSGKNFDLLQDYKIGKSYKLKDYDNKTIQCSSGYHFAKESKYNQYFQKLDIWSVCSSGFYINACLKCEVKEKDIIFVGSDKIRAKAFKVLNEVDAYCYGRDR